MLYEREYVAWLYSTNKVKHKAMLIDYLENWEMYDKFLAATGLEDIANGWNEDRIDIIGQNGSSGTHYHTICNICGILYVHKLECAYTGCPRPYGD